MTSKNTGMEKVVLFYYHPKQQTWRNRLTVIIDTIIGRDWYMTYEYEDLKKRFEDIGLTITKTYDR